jgi:serine/threonine protein kinase
LKPENLVIEKRLSHTSLPEKEEEAQSMNMFDTVIKIIDFGSAVGEQEYHQPMVTTVNYRAPEVIL